MSKKKEFKAFCVLDPFQPFPEIYYWVNNMPLKNHRGRNLFPMYKKTHNFSLNIAMHLGTEI